MPIFYSSALHPSLFLLQHPQLPAHPDALPADNLTLEFKPTSNSLSLHVPLDTSLPSFNSKAAERFARTVSDATTPPLAFESCGESMILDKLVYSADLLPKHASYLVGLVKGGALHLHPVSHAVQFRNDPSYLDDFSTPTPLNSSSIAANGMSSATGSSLKKESDEGVKGKALTVRVCVSLLFRDLCVSCLSAVFHVKVTELESCPLDLDHGSILSPLP